MAKLCPHRSCFSYATILQTRMKKNHIVYKASYLGEGGLSTPLHEEGGAARLTLPAAQCWCPACTRSCGLFWFHTAATKENPAVQVMSAMDCFKYSAVCGAVWGTGISVPNPDSLVCVYS